MKKVRIDGVLLLKKVDPKIVLKCRWVRVSVDAASPETYEIVKGTNKQLFFRISDTARTLAEEKKRKVYCKIKYVQ